jgi:hypothetical protein
MKRIVQIGRGIRPCAALETAEERYLVDSSLPALEQVFKREVHLTPIGGSVTALPFPHASVNTVETSNIFGDRFLAPSPSQRDKKVELLEWALAATKGSSIIEECKDEVSSTSDDLKTAMLQESGRVLVPDGQLFILETESPEVADSYLYRIGSQAASMAGLHLAEASLPQELPAAYAASYADNPQLRLWIATKV